MEFKYFPSHPNSIKKDKTTGKEYRVFVDAYTLEEVEDKPATETEPGVWSMYDKILTNGKENNLKEWQKSDELAKSIEQQLIKELILMLQLLKKILKNSIVMQ